MTNMTPEEQRAADLWWKQYCAERSSKNAPRRLRARAARLRSQAAALEARAERLEARPSCAPTLEPKPPAGV